MTDGKVLPFLGKLICDARLGDAQMESNRSGCARSQLSRPSPATALTTVAVLVAACVGLSVCELFPLTVERGIYVPPDTSASPDGGDVTPVKTFSLVQSGPVALMLNTFGSPTAWAPHLGTAFDSNLTNALSRVPVKAKLQALLTLLVSEGDPAERAELVTKLQALLKLPEDVLLQVLEHPDLVEFNKMLDAVFLGDTELWWFEVQLDKISVVPVTKTTSRIDVSGKPAFMFDSTAAAHTDSGGQPTSGLKALSPTSSESQTPSEPQVSMTMVSRSVPDAGVTTFDAPVSSDVQVSRFSESAPAMDVKASAAPGPDPTLVASPPLSNAEISNAAVGIEPTPSSEVFDTGNRFQPGETVESSPASSASLPTETDTPPPPAADEAANGTPSSDQNESGTPGDDPSP
jgi:hypothetical protein